MAAKGATAETLTLVDGSFDFSGGVDSSKVTTLESALNPNGLKRNQLAWLNNGSVRTTGINQRTGLQPIAKLIDSGYYQGGFLYEPDGANPYLVCQVSGEIFMALLEAPFTITNLSAVFNLTNPPDPAVAEMAFFCQAENYLIIQAGDYFHPGAPIPGKTDATGHTLPLFWDGTTLRRSIGITNLAPAQAPNQNEIPAGTEMDYYGNRLWYAQARSFAAGDMVGGPSGTAPNHFRDAVLNVTENPLCFGGDGFTVPTSAGNIRAIKHSAQQNASLGQGQLYIFTRKTVYQMVVPPTRVDWISADANNQPQLLVVQLVNGSVGGRSVVPINGDLYYQSFDPAIRSLRRAQQYFDQPGNTAISQNEQRVLQLNDRSLMRFSSAIPFDSRVLNLLLPQVALDGSNIVHSAIAPLDFDTVTNLEERKSPVWEGVYDGLQFLELYAGDFGGLPRAFTVAISETDGSIQIWELTTSSRTDNGDNRVVWGPEFPAFTWSSSGYEFKLKQLNGGELWVDKVSGTVDMDVYYRVDADPCWRKWFRCSFCAKRCEDEDAWDSAYPCTPNREGYKFPIVFPEPPAACDSMNVRPTTIGYQFQVKILFKGWCRVRGILLHALPKEKPTFEGMCCGDNPQTTMATIPNPFA